MQHRRTDVDTAALGVWLRARRDEILALGDRSAESREEVVLDETRSGRLTRNDALQQHAMALEMERRRQAELRRVEAALKRLEEGEYGYCVSCGEEIGIKRLELDPATATCIDCARR